MGAGAVPARGDKKVDNQAGMVSLGRPGAGERLLAEHGFADVERIDVPFAWEFADPDAYARALAATGPAYETIQNVGEANFRQAAVEQARERQREGLPLAGRDQRRRLPRPQTGR